MLSPYLESQYWRGGNFHAPKFYDDKIMTEDEKYWTILAMEKFGGSFVKALANALRCADMSNTVKIYNAWPDYLKEYGPGSEFYEAVKTIESE